MDGDVFRADEMKVSGFTCYKGARRPPPSDRLCATVEARYPAQMFRLLPRQLATGESVATAFALVKLAGICSTLTKRPRRSISDRARDRARLEQR